MSSAHKRSLAATFCLLSSNAVGSAFALRSDQASCQQFRKHCGPDGMPQTKLVPSNLQALLFSSVQAGADIFTEIAHKQANVIYAITDTGASCTYTNDPDDFEPGTLIKLDQPKVIGGIAGGLAVECKGMISWETVDKDGNVITFRTEGPLAKGLPC